MKKISKTIIASFIVTFAGAILLCSLTKWVAAMFGIELHDQNSLALLKSLHGWRLYLFIAYALIIAPVGEELVFRGLLFRLPAHFIKFKTSKIFFAIVSSVLFVAAHYGKINPFPDNAFIALFYFAIIQCALYDMTKRIWYPMMNHILFNLANLAFAVTTLDA